MALTRGVLGIAAAALVAAGALGVIGLHATRAHGNPQPAPAAQPEPALAGTPGDEIETPPPPFSEGSFPCTRCHKPGPDFDNDRRDLGDPHDKIKFEHDAEHRWCLDCHNGEERDHLRLASGQLIDFKESYKLCGQCHGDKYRDWRAGIHGRRTGSWEGHKRYLLCVNCHNPHSPRFRPVRPEPPPRRPEAIR
jgi:hypothetical protein